MRKTEVTIALILTALTLLICGLLVWGSVVFGPPPKTPQQWFGVVSGVVALCVSTLVACIFPFLLTLEGERKRATDAEAARFSRELDRACDDLRTSVARFKERVVLALETPETGREHLVAAKDNAQQISNVIIHLSRLCGRDLSSDSKFIEHVDSSISQMGRTLIGARETISDLADIGSRIDEAQEKLNEERQDDVGVSMADVDRLLKELRADIGSKIASIQNETERAESARPAEREIRLPFKRQREKVSVACPYCGEATEIQIGTAAGDSAAPTCPQGHRFHAHRGQLGVFARRQGEPSATAPLSVRKEFSCPNPNCGRTIPALVPEGSTDELTRWCFHCGWKAKLLVATESALSLGPRDIVEGEWKDSATCPTHGRQLHVYRDNEEEVVGSCEDCDGLVRLAKTGETAAAAA